MDWGKFKLSLENKTNFKISLKSTNYIDERLNLLIDERLNLLIKSIQESPWSCSTSIPHVYQSRSLPWRIIITVFVLNFLLLLRYF